MCIKSFIRLSYSVLYPTVLTIAVNIYFGLSVDNLCTEEFQISTYIPIIMFGLFFIISAGIEFLSYKKEDNKKNVNFSTYGFVIISILALIVSISADYAKSERQFRVNGAAVPFPTAHQRRPLFIDFVTLAHAYSVHSFQDGKNVFCQ